MINRILKLIGWIVTGVLLLITAAFAFFYFQVEARLAKHYQVIPQYLEVSYDSAQLAYGERLTLVKGCRDCHGDNLSGRIFLDDPALGRIIGKNLTRGKGGLPDDYSTDDWVLAMKHGIRRDGKSLLFMPSYEFTLLSEEDMAAIIAYARQLPPVDNQLPDHALRPLGYVLTALDQFPLIPAERIDHSSTLVRKVKAEVTVDFGKYLANSCIGCHRPDMKGGDPIAPGFPPVPDITSAGNPGKWTESQFMEVLRTGKTPEGKTLDPANMPWNMTAAYTDTELKALYTYIKSL
ncbi:MAG: c-type cytochrome [Cyclobacteriaceae bacterium]|nr:c-type cytochrome [Cyclobacteriaceae bacterium]